MHISVFNSGIRSHPVSDVNGKSLKMKAVCSVQPHGQIPYYQL